jgi:hypothetical protein
LYRSTYVLRMTKSKILRWTDHVVRMEEDRSPFKVLTGKISLERPRGRCEGNVRKDLKDVGVSMRN